MDLWTATLTGHAGRRVLGADSKDPSHFLQLPSAQRAATMFLYDPAPSSLSFIQLFATVIN
jgi:hypothetical protein